MVIVKHSNVPQDVSLCVFMYNCTFILLVTRIDRFCTIFLPLFSAINRLHEFNKLLSDWPGATRRCVLSDISWQSALVTGRVEGVVEREEAGGSERETDCIWGFWQGEELVCLAGPSHLGSICVSLEWDRQLQSVRNRRCERT